MARGDIQAGGAFVRLFLKDDMTRKLSGAIRGAGQSVQNLGASVTRIGAPIAAMGTAITGALTGAVVHFAAVGDNLDKMAGRTGFAASSLAELGFAAEQSGATMEDVEKAILKMNRRVGRISVGQGSGQQVAAMEELGLSAEKLNQMKPEERFMAIADAMANYGDDAAAAGLSQRAFGTSVDKILPLLLQGRDGIQALRQEAQDLNIVPSDDEVKNAAKVTDAINRVKKVVGGMLFDVGAALAGPVLDGLETVKNIGVWIGRWVSANRGLVQTIAMIGGVLMAAGTGIMMFGGALIGIGLALKAAAAVVTVLGAAVGLVFSPIGLLVAALVGGVVAWAKFTDSGKAAVGGLMDLFGNLLAIGKEAFGGILSAIKSGDYKLAGQIAIDGIKAAWFEGVASLVEIWGGFAKAVVETFAGAMNQVAKLWVSVQGKISKGILSMAEDKGVVGDLMAKLLGVDVRKEKQQQDRKMMRKAGMGQRMKEQQRMLEEAEAREAAEAAMSPEERDAAIAKRKSDQENYGVVTHTADELRAMIAETKDLMTSENYGLTDKQMEVADVAHAMDVVDEQTKMSLTAIDEKTGSFLASFSQYLATAEDRADAAKAELKKSVGAAKGKEADKAVGELIGKGLSWWRSKEETAAGPLGGEAVAAGSIARIATTQSASSAMAMGYGMSAGVGTFTSPAQETNSLLREVIGSVSWIQKIQQNIESIAGGLRQ